MSYMEYNQNDIEKIRKILNDNPVGPAEELLAVFLKRMEQPTDFVTGVLNQVDMDYVEYELSGGYTLRDIAYYMGDSDEFFYDRLRDVCDALDLKKKEK